MKYDLFGRIAKIGVGGLMGLVIGTMAVAGDQPSSAAQSGQEEIMAGLNAQAKVVEAALDDLRAKLKVADDLQAALEKEAGRKGQAEAAAQAGGEARKAVEQNITDLKSSMAAAEKELGALEKQKKAIAKLQETLAQLSRQRAEAEAEAQRVQAARLAAGQDLAAHKAKLAEVLQQAATVQEQEKKIRALQDEIGKEQDLRESLIDDTALVNKAAQADEKERAGLQAQADAQAKRVAEGLSRQKEMLQIQAELAREKQARAASEAGIVAANQARVAAAQVMAGLKQKLVEGEDQALSLEKQVKTLGRLQSELAEARKLKAEMSSEVLSVTASREEIEKAVAVFSARLATLQTNLSALAAQAKQAQALQDEIGKEKQLRAVLLQDAAKAREALQAAEKEKAGLQAQADAQSQRVAEALSQQKDMLQMQAELTREKQARVASEAGIVEANQARAAAMQAVAELKQKLDEGEERLRLMAKQDKFLMQKQEDLAKARKLSAEAAAGLQQVTAARVAAEQDITALKARLAEVSQKSATAQEQAKQIQTLQDEIVKEQQAQASLLRKMEQAGEAVRAATSERADLQAQADAAAKRAADGQNQTKTLEQLRDNLAQAKRAQTEAEAKLKSTAASQETVQKEIAGLKNKIEDLEDQLEKQSKQDKVQKDLQAELGDEQQARKELEAKADEKAQALAAAEKEQNALKSRLVDMEQQYKTKLDQVKAVAQVQADLKKERELRAQTDQRIADLAAREKANARQISELKDQLQTVSKKDAALTKDLERQSPAALPPAVASKQASGEPESLAAAEQRIIAQAKGETPSGAPEAAQVVDSAKTARAQRSAGSEADQYLMFGIQKWDAGDVDGAIAEFKKAIRHDSSLAGAYYNIALGYAKKGDREEACDYAYQAGEIYLKNKNNTQATRMVVLIKNIDPSSSLIEKLRNKIHQK